MDNDIELSTVDKSLVNEKKTNQQVVHNFVDSFFLLVLKMIDVLLTVLPNDANDLTSAINEDNVNTNESSV